MRCIHICPSLNGFNYFHRIATVDQFEYILTAHLGDFTNAIKMSEVEETIKRLSSHKGVEGIVIVNMDGIPIRTTLDHEKTIQHSALITQLTAKAKSMIRDLDPQVIIVD
jgi:hypothetical protein